MLARTARLRLACFCHGGQLPTHFGRSSLQASPASKEAAKTKEAKTEPAPRRKSLSLSAQIVGYERVKPLRSVEPGDVSDRSAPCVDRPVDVVLDVDSGVQGKLLREVTAAARRRSVSVNWSEPPPSAPLPPSDEAKAFAFRASPKFTKKRQRATSITEALSDFDRSALVTPDETCDRSEPRLEAGTGAGEDPRPAMLEELVGEALRRASNRGWVEPPPEAPAPPLLSPARSSAASGSRPRNKSITQLISDLSVSGTSPLKPVAQRNDRSDPVVWSDVTLATLVNRRPDLLSDIVKVATERAAARKWSEPPPSAPEPPPPVRESPVKPSGRRRNKSISQQINGFAGIDAPLRQAQKAWDRSEPVVWSDVETTLVQDTARPSVLQDVARAARRRSVSLGFAEQLGFGAPGALGALPKAPPPPQSPIRSPAKRNRAKSISHQIAGFADVSPLRDTDVNDRSAPRLEPGTGANPSPHTALLDELRRLGIVEPPPPSPSARQGADMAAAGRKLFSRLVAP